MARARGPLYSIGASGTISDTIIFQAWKGIHRIKNYKKPKQPDSPSQMLIRSFITMAVRKWQTITNEQKEQYQTMVDNKRLKQSGYSYFIGVYTRAMYDGVSPPFEPIIEEWTPPLNGLISWWKFDEGSGLTTIDSINNNDGTLINDPTWVDGKRGKALSFDGTDDLVTIANKNNFDFEINSSFSISAWVYSNDVTEGMFVSKRIPASPYTGWDFGLFNNAGLLKLTLLLYHYNGATHKWLYRRQNLEFPKDVYKYVVCTYDGSSTLAGMLLYVDGVLVTDYSDNQRGVPDTILNNEPVRIGVDLNLSRYFKGIIDEILIYNRVLTDEEILKLYNDTK